MQFSIGQFCHHDGAVWEILDVTVKDGAIGLVLGDARYTGSMLDAGAECVTREVFDFADIVPMRIAA